jgi:tripartite-type tricarboxylate transporter receptor subunit TctC
MAEAGVQGVDFYGWLGVHMPAGVPAATVKRMSDLLNGIMASPEMKKFVRVNGYEPFSGNPEQFTAFEASEFAKWAHLVKIAKIRAQ